MSPVAADPVKRAEKPGRLSDEQLLDALREIAAELAVLNPRQEALWRARVILYHEGRKREGKLVISSLADASGVSTVAVISALKKADPLAPVPG